MTAAKKSQEVRSTANAATEEAIIAFLRTLGIRKVIAGNGKHDSGEAKNPNHEDDKPKALVINGDALHVLRQIKLDSFVDTVVTSPPYYKLRPALVGGEIGQENTIDEYLDDLVAVFDQVRRILKDSGSLWVNIGERIIEEEEQQIPARFALLMREHGWILHKTVVWAKPNYNPAGRKKNFPATFEHIFWFAQSHDFYWNPIKEERRTDPVAETLMLQRLRNKKQSITGPGWKGRFGRKEWSAAEHLKSIQAGKAMIDVWTIASTGHGISDHTEPFPVEIPRRALMATCPPCGVAMDPFSGIGSTGVAAINQGKDYIGIELNPKYAELATRSLAIEMSSETPPS